MPDNTAVRLLGGSPLTVFVRLCAVSLLVGAIMAWLGIDGLDLLDDLQRGLAHLYGTGFAAVRDIGRTAIAGAAVVVPVWFVIRMLSYRGPRPRLDPDDHRHGAGGRDARRWTNPERVGGDRRP